MFLEDVNPKGWILSWCRWRVRRRDVWRAGSEECKRKWCYGMLATPRCVGMVWNYGQRAAV